MSSKEKRFPSGFSSEKTFQEKREGERYAGNEEGKKEQSKGRGNEKKFTWFFQKIVNSETQGDRDHS